MNARAGKIWRVEVIWPDISYTFLVTDAFGHLRKLMNCLFRKFIHVWPLTKFSYHSWMLSCGLLKIPFSIRRPRSRKGQWLLLSIILDYIIRVFHLFCVWVSDESLKMVFFCHFSTWNFLFVSETPDSFQFREKNGSGRK